MTEQEAADKMNEMWDAVQTFKLPERFKLSVDYDGDFAAGEPFYYKGIRCFATPEK